jgi:hypothetical protein
MFSKGRPDFGWRRTAQILWQKSHVTPSSAVPVTRVGSTLYGSPTVAAGT